MTRTYQQLVGFQPLTFVYHLMNMIAEGVFEQFPDLKVVFADGAADMLTPMIWRMDTFGRPHLEQTPWAPRMPSDYLPGHVYFVNGALDTPGDVDFAGEWLRMTGKEDMLLFGSSYPDWQWRPPRRCPARGRRSSGKRCSGTTHPSCTGCRSRQRSDREKKEP